ncbi:long-chain-fatty-acid-CoA ligase [Paenibacillus sp. JCM 10914]|nr:long-chain-fatty-acid-CoA ligase [Paenibacillus sp. JCM 10914]
MTSSLLGTMEAETLPDLRTVIVGGDVCTAELVEQWGEGRGFFNCYGPTEATVCTTMKQCESDGKMPSIGRPIANTQVYVLDGEMQLVTPGVSGELYIGGAGLARGYWNRSELTAEKFIVHPQWNERLYRTGDLVRWQQDGNLEYLGRIDEQVKVRGYRIELGEIEAALLRHLPVRESAVIVRDDMASDKTIVAYVVTSGVVEQGELREHLKATLPDYMVPSYFMTLGSLPLTPNGKLDRKALPAPEVVGRGEYVAPRTEAEQKLAEIWRQVLRAEQVGIYDNFFELGGDSILSIQIVSRANQAGLKLTPRQMFAFQTIAELAEAAGTQVVVEAEQGQVMGEVPLTPIQQWFFEQPLENRNHWNQSLLLSVREPLKEEALKAALHHLVNHHDALRLRFRQEKDGVWKQDHTEIRDIPLWWEDFSSLPREHQRAAVERQAEKAQSSLNVNHGLLLRVVYFDLGRGEARLLLVIHHLAVDGVSWQILLEDLQTAYVQCLNEMEVRLPVKTTSYKQWAERLEQFAGSEKSLEAEIKYWTSSDYQGSFPALPLDYQGGVNTEASTERFTVSMSMEESHSLLNEVPLVYHTQPSIILMTALLLAFNRWTGDKRLAFSLEGHGREDIIEGVDMSRTVGWFTSMYPLILVKEENQSLDGIIKQVKEQVNRVPRKGIGYGILRYLNGIGDQLPSGPDSRPSVGFNYMGHVDRMVDENSMFAGASEFGGNNFGESNQRYHLIDVNLVVLAKQLHINWSYSKNCHRRETIEGVSRYYAESLRDLIAQIHSPDAGGYTPSDFEDFGWDQDDLDEFLEAFRTTDD